MASKDLDLVSRDRLASLFSCDARTIDNLVGEGMPKAARGTYALSKCVPWYLERERERARGAKGLNDLDLARQRKIIAEALLAERELAQLESRLIPVEVHEQELRARLDTVAGAVKAIHRYQPDVKAAVTDVAADGLLDKMADAILAELYALSDEIPE